MRCLVGLELQSRYVSAMVAAEKHREAQQREWRDLDSEYIRQWERLEEEHLSARAAWLEHRRQCPECRLSIPSL
jgi:hypothetical protein